MIGWAFAAQLAVVAHAPPTVTECAPFEITAAASAPGRVAPRLAAPAAGWLELLSTTATSHVDDDPAGRPVAVTEATFRMAASGAGRLRIPRVRAELPGVTMQSASLPLLVEASGADEDAPPIVSVSARVEPERDDLAAPRYVGEQVVYVVDVRLNAAARHALRRNPTFFPPDMPSVLAYDLAAPPPSRSRAAARCFERLTYQRALFPLFAGRTVIAPAVLAYSLPVSPSYFSREEQHELRTDSVVIVAAEPPTAGRPAAYEGAVGVLRATSRIDAPHGRMGDPLVLTVRVEGAGNVKLLPRPRLALDWAAVVPAAERVTVDSTHAVVRGAKEFDWLVTPRVAGPRVIALAPYYFFDPSRAAYDSTQPAPLALDVAAAPLVAADTAAPRPRLAIRPVLRPERGAPFSERPAYWLLFALAPVPATVRHLARGRRPVRARVSAARQLARAVASGTPLDARELRALFVHAVQERVSGPLRPAQRRSIARHLRLAGVTPPTADAAGALLALLDAAAYAGAALDVRQATAEALRVARAIDAEAVGRRAARSPRAPFALGWLALLAVLTVAAQPPAFRADEVFAHGARAYAAGDLARARRDFAQVATHVPRALDGWANLGTTAWAAGDTAQASLAWQRALRLDPLDGEVRVRLAELPAPPSVGATGYVPPLRVDTLAAVALAAWVAGWLALAGPRRPGTGAVRRLGLLSIVFAVAMLGGAVALRHRLDARQLAVLRRTTPVRIEPLASSTPAGAGTIGEVARLGRSSGLFTRVTLDGARAGWLPTDALSPMDERAAN